MKQRLFTLCLALASVTLSGMAESYGIFVGGVEVTSKNCNNVTGGDIKAYSSSVNGGKPSVTFVKGDDTKQSVLTLWNVKIDRTGNNNRAINNKSDESLRIVFKGENYLRTTNASTIRIEKATTINTEAYNGVEKTTVISTKENAIRAVSGASLHIYNSNLELSAQNDDCLDSEGEPWLVIGNSTVTATSTSTKSGDNYAVKNFKRMEVSNSTVTLTGYSQAVYGLKDLSLGKGQKDIVTPGTGDGFGGYKKSDGYLHFYAYKQTDSGFTTIDDPKTVKLQMTQYYWYDWDFFKNMGSGKVANGNSTVDPDGDLYVSLTERMLVTEIDLRKADSPFPDMKCIELFENLESLSCAYKHVKSLDVSKNKKLKTLNCSNNNLSSLDLSKNTKLETLDCSWNALTSLNLSNNTRLTSLNCCNNRDDNDDFTLMSLDVSKNTLLTNLDCSFNPIGTLDVSKNTQLTSLDCYMCRLQTLDVSKNTKLQTLNCYWNALSSLDLSNNTKLVSLDCHANVNRDNGNYSLKTLNISKNAPLTYLVYSSTEVKSLDLSIYTKLETLICSYNKLTSLDVSKNTKLKTLDCSYNKLTKLDVTKNTLLTELDCSANIIKGKQMTNLINSMPKVTTGTMKVCQKNLTDDNTITTAQVKTIKGKGWTVLRNDGENWVGYAGRGDTNYNGFIDETDLKNIVQAIMGKTPSNVQKDECDVNADGKVNAADAVGAVNEIKGK